MEFFQSLLKLHKYTFTFNVTFINIFLFMAGKLKSVLVFGSITSLRCFLTLRSWFRKEVNKLTDLARD